MGSPVVERAERIVAANLSDRIAIARLCRATGVSERTLRNAFYREHGSGPKRALLRQRLEMVRDALGRSESNTTVATVATAHGFFELGRFAGRYRAAFGEYPSETLRRRVREQIDQPARILPTTGPADQPST